MKKVKTGDTSDRSPPAADQAGTQKPACKTKKTQANDILGRLEELETRLSDDLPIDAQRINDMKNAIANGEYHVDAESIANKMIDFESLLKK